MIGDFKVITLCGSTKLKDDYEYWNARLTLEGNLVFSCGVFGHIDGIILSEEDKESLDEIHKRKIDLSDEIFVINTNNYIGNSTRSEIEYATKTGKKVLYASDFHIHDLLKDNGFL